MARKLAPHEPTVGPDADGFGETRQGSDGLRPIKLIDIALGQHPAVMGAGEIATLARHVWHEDEFCACGVPVSRCDHWREIVGQWRQDEDKDFLARYQHAQVITESIVARGRMPGGVGRSGYAASTAKLLRAMADVSGRSILVDSSKLPGRGFASLDLPGVETYVIHVVRDGRGVAWSMAKGYGRQVEKGVQRELRPKSLIRTALRWSIVNIAADLLCRRAGKSRSMRVRYEDFAADPDASIARILTLIGERKPAPVGDGAARIVPQHQVAGSRHRMAKSIVVKKDEAWKSEMPPRKQLLVTAICAPLLRRYGYSLGPGSPSLISEDTDP